MLHNIGRVVLLIGCVVLPGLSGCKECMALPCPSGAPFNQDTCQCEAGSSDGGSPDGSQDTAAD